MYTSENRIKKLIKKAFILSSATASAIVPSAFLLSNNMFWDNQPVEKEQVKQVDSDQWHDKDMYRYFYHPSDVKDDSYNLFLNHQTPNTDLYANAVNYLAPISGYKNFMDYYRSSNADWGTIKGQTHHIATNNAVRLSFSHEWYTAKEAYGKEAYPASDKDKKFYLFDFFSWKSGDEQSNTHLLDKPHYLYFNSPTEISNEMNSRGAHNNDEKFMQKIYRELDDIEHRRNTHRYHISAGHDSSFADNYHAIYVKIEDKSHLTPISRCGAERIVEEKSNNATIVHDEIYDRYLMDKNIQDFNKYAIHLKFLFDKDCIEKTVNKERIKDYKFTLYYYSQNNINLIGTQFIDVPYQDIKNDFLFKGREIFLTDKEFNEEKTHVINSDANECKHNWAIYDPHSPGKETLFVMDKINAWAPTSRLSFPYAHPLCVLTNSYKHETQGYELNNMGMINKYIDNHHFYPDMFGNNVDYDLTISSDSDSITITSRNGKFATNARFNQNNEFVEFSNKLIFSIPQTYDGNLRLRFKIMPTRNIAPLTINTVVNAHYENKLDSLIEQDWGEVSYE